MHFGDGRVRDLCLNGCRRPGPRRIRSVRGREERETRVRSIGLRSVTPIEYLHSRPDPYLLGAKRAGVDPSRCLVVEDAPAGIRSGRAAGCKTLGLVTSHSRAQMEEVKPDWLVPNLAR